MENYEYILREDRLKAAEEYFRVDNFDDVEWITVKGNHIPVKKGQSKKEAIDEFLNKNKSIKTTYSKGDKFRFKSNRHESSLCEVLDVYGDSIKYRSGHKYYTAPIDYIIDETQKVQD